MLMVKGFCCCGQLWLSSALSCTTTYGSCGYGYVGYSNSIVCRRLHTAGATVTITAESKPRKSVRFSFNSMQMTTEFALSAVSVAVIFLLTTVAVAVADVDALQSEESGTLSNVPQMLSGDCISPGDCKKPRIQRPKSPKAENCTVKCLTTCIRGGLGSPGEGPFNIRRPLVVFKQGFRSRQYCLVECSDICNLIGDGDDGP